MSGTSRERADLEEMLLPLDSVEPASPPMPSAPPPLPPPEPERPAPPRRSRRGRQEPLPFPSPEAFAEEVLRHVQRRLPELTEPLGSNVDLITRQVGTATLRLSESAAQIREAEQTLGRTATSFSDQTREVREICEAQAAAMCESWTKAGESFAESAREASSNMGLARHELALSVAELKRHVFRYGALFGGGTAILILLAVRLLFPFWGMKRTDVEAWSRGTELARTYLAARPERREAILCALGWESMPGVTPPPSVSSALRAGGR
jgi:hypothetical protein